MKEAIKQWRAKYKHLEPALFFACGFLFDVFTLRRIDDWLKLNFQILFLLILGWFLGVQYRSAEPGWQVPKLLSKIWTYQVDIVHFLFGSLLSAYVIFYFKSASATRSVVFLLLVIVLMVLNELEFVRRQGVKLRVVLYSFCLASFFIYVFPVIVGGISNFLFYSALIFASAITWYLVFRLTRKDPIEVRKKNILKMGLPSTGVHLILLIFYFFKVIPPVPLSMTFGGIYHKIEKVEGGGFELYSLKPWYNFWSHGDKDFLARDQEPIYCFVRVFAPARFSHTIFLRWQLYDTRLKRFTDQDRIGMPIAGGRDEGYRGYAFKSHYQPGKWKVIVETEDERPIGEIPFQIEQDKSIDDRVWMIEPG